MVDPRPQPATPSSPSQDAETARSAESAMGPGSLLGLEPTDEAPAELAPRAEAVEPRWLMDLRAGKASTIPSQEGADLSGLDLSDLDFTGVSFSGADLSGAKLQNARLFGVDMTGAQLVGVRAQSAEFTGANLTGATLTQGEFDHAGFGAANLDGVVARDASFREAALSGCSAHGASFAAADLSGARLLDANLAKADFQAANLEEADLTSSRVEGATFRRASLRGAKLVGVIGYLKADWIFAELDDSIPVGGALLREYVRDQNFLHEFRHQSPMHEWTYRIWWLTSDCGRSVLRWGACSLALSLFFSVVYTVVAVDYGANATWLSPFYFSVVTFSTLGFGDILPVSAAAQTVVIVEVILGYVMLGGMLSLISNKLARRAG